MTDHQQEEEKRYPLKQQAGFAGGTFVTMALVDMLAHLGPTGLLVSGLASYVAWKHGPEIYEHVSGQVRGIIPAHLPETEQPERRAGRSLWDRALGHYPESGEPPLDEENERELAEFLEEWEEAQETHDQVLLNLSQTWSPLVDSFLSQRTAILGQPGSGKSNTVAIIIEEIGPLEVPILLCDTEGEYSGLCHPRYLPKGVTVGAEHVSLKNAKAFGQSILEKRLQVILNLQSYQTDDEAALVMCEIIAGMNAWEEAQTKRVSCMIILDEAAVWLPQNQAESILSKAKDQDGLTTLARLQQTFFSTVVRRGRKRGIGFLLATQRIAEIDKRALSATWMILHRQNLPNDLKVYERYGIESEAAINLKPGQAYVLGPDNFREIVQFRKRHSRDMAFTPGLASVRGDLPTKTQHSPISSQATRTKPRVSEPPEAALPTKTLYHTRRAGLEDVAKRRRERELRQRGIYGRGNTGNGALTDAETNAEADSSPTRETGVNVSTISISAISASGEIDTSGISTEVREMIRRSHNMKPPLPHNKVAALVGLGGRHYGIYQQLCREMDLR